MQYVSLFKHGHITDNLNKFIISKQKLQGAHSSNSVSVGLCHVTGMMELQKHGIQNHKTPTTCHQQLKTVN